MIKPCSIAITAYTPPEIHTGIRTLDDMDAKLDCVAARAVGPINEDNVGPYMAKLLVSHRQRQLEDFVQSFQVCARKTDGGPLVMKTTHVLFFF
jgi:hypothetical protein